MVLLVFFAFLAGLVTILSPCILPVLPLVLSGSVGGGHKRPLGVTFGFILSFTVFTLFLSSIVKATGIPSDYLRNISVVILIFFGLSLLFPAFQNFSEKMFSKIISVINISPGNAGNGLVGGFILGLTLGLIWTPCVGPIIASVITLAAANSVNGGAVLITLAYSTGTAIPMFLIIYFGRTVFKKTPWISQHSSDIQKIFGITMILVSVLIFLNFDRQFQTFILTKFPQYGAGLTKIEDNKLVKNALKDLKNVKDSASSVQTSDMYPAAPQLVVGGKWFNTQPLSIQNLKGKVVLVDFWTYTCINCIRTLPYVKSWDQKYRDKGLVIIGVHTPEFEFEKNPDNVSKAIDDFAIRYPVMQDNDYQTWNAYNNEYWPADYLIDKNGKIRDTHFGEGDYDKTEQEIQNLLKETGATVTEPIHNPGYTIDTASPETYLGYDRLGNFASPQPVLRNSDSTYTIPHDLPLNSFAYEGVWQINKQTATPQKGASMAYHFKAKDVYLVMNTKSDNSKVAVYLDGKPYQGSQNTDVSDQTLTVGENRLFHILHFTNAEEHILLLKFEDNNASVFAFTFG